VKRSCYFAASRECVPWLENKKIKRECVPLIFNNHARARGRSNILPHKESAHILLQVIVAANSMRTVAKKILKKKERMRTAYLQQ